MLYLVLSKANLSMKFIPGDGEITNLISKYFLKIVLFLIMHNGGGL